MFYRFVFIFMFGFHALLAKPELLGRYRTNGGYIVCFYSGDDDAAAGSSAIPVTIFAHVMYGNLMAKNVPIRLDRGETGDLQSEVVRICRQRSGQAVTVLLRRNKTPIAILINSGADSNETGEGSSDIPAEYRGPMDGQWLAKRIRENIGGGSKQYIEDQNRLICMGIQGLHWLPPEETADPLGLFLGLSECLDSFQHKQKEGPVGYGVVLETARLMHRYLWASFFVSRDRLLRKQKNDLLASLGDACRLIREGSTHMGNGVRFELECVEELVESIATPNKTKREALEALLSGAFANLFDGTGMLKFLVAELSEDARRNAVRNLNEYCYGKVNYYRCLADRIVEDGQRAASEREKRFQELNELLSETLSKKRAVATTGWREFYAGLMALEKIIWESTDPQKRDGAYETLKRYADFNESVFTDENTWRIREKVVDILIGLQGHYVGWIREDAERQIIRRLDDTHNPSHERDEKVRHLLENPDYVTAIQNELAKDYSHLVQKEEVQGGGDWKVRYLLVPLGFSTAAFAALSSYYYMQLKQKEHDADDANMDLARCTEKEIKCDAEKEQLLSIFRILGEAAISALVGNVWRLLLPGHKTKQI